MPDSPSDTPLLQAVPEWDSKATAKLVSEVYNRLRSLAQVMIADEPPGLTLQPTALVHEAYLRLEESGHPTWKDARHFVNTAARAMRHVLVDRARWVAAAKHGGGRRVTLHEETVAAKPEVTDILALDGALDRLAQYNPRWEEIVHLRYFAGLSVEGTAATMGVSPTTVKDGWKHARAWLLRDIGEGVGAKA